MDGTFEISNVYATPYERDNLVGLGTVYFGNAFVFDKVRVKEGQNGVYVEGSMYRATKRREDGTPELNEKGENVYEYKPYFHAITSEAYEKLRDCVVDVLNRKTHGQTQTTSQALGNGNADDDLIPFVDNGQGR